MQLNHNHNYNLLFDFPRTGICPWNYFVCSNGKCLPHIFKCDGQDNCGDGSDESGETCIYGHSRKRRRRSINSETHSGVVPSNNL